MSSSEAQKSPVHHATEDSTAEPTNAQRSPQGSPGGTAGPGRGKPKTEGDAGVAGDAARLHGRPDTAMGVPGNFERGAAMADRNPDTDEEANPPGAATIGGGPGAGDASSGGGAGAGIPGGGTDLRTGGAFSGGDVDEDRRKLFPGAASGPGSPPDDVRPGVTRDDLQVGKDPDESTYGGPLNLDDPKNV